MPAYKDEKTGKWMSRFYYENHNGERKQKKKRGFITKREAQEFEREFLLQQQGNPEMKLETLAEEYLKDAKVRVRDTTFYRKKNIFKTHIIPYFGKKPVNAIKVKDIRKWQNHMMEKTNKYSKPYSQTYLKGVNNELSALFNYAVDVHELKANPVRQAGSMGRKNREEITFWTIDEFNQSMNQLNAQDSTEFMYLFIYHLLFYTGMRIGELQALSLNDFNFETKTISITKTYVTANVKNKIRKPKTENSIRDIVAPDFIFDMLKQYLDTLYGYEPNQRLFTVVKSSIGNKLNTLAKHAGVKKIRIHDLRHSHASHLINLGVNALTIQERLGHKNIETTLNTYSHLYPTKQAEVAALLNKSKLSPGQ
ncbi:MAG: site-specific integrase [Aerococcus sanguinicola]